MADGPAPTVYCPTCGYNLTGLPDDVCPECGVRFDARMLAQMLRQQPEPIGLGELLLRLCWPPAVVALAVASLTLLQQAGVILSVGAGVFVLIYGLFNARSLAIRLSASRVGPDGLPRRPDENRRFVYLVAPGLWFCQLAMAVGGCVAVAAATL